MRVSVGHAGISFLAAEGSPEQYVVRLRRADEKRLDLVSYGAASPDGVDTLASQLLGAGVRLISEPGQLTTPGGGYGFRFFDVDGRTLEVSAEVAARTHRRIEEQESIPVRLSHVVLSRSTTWTAGCSSPRRCEAPGCAWPVTSWTASGTAGWLRVSRCGRSRPGPACSA